jgi:hypothetical protein
LTGFRTISAELIHAAGEALHYGIHEFTDTILNKKVLPSQWKEPIIVTYVFTTKAIKLN